MDLDQRPAIKILRIWCEKREDETCADDRWDNANEGWVESAYFAPLAH